MAMVLYNSELPDEIIENIILRLDAKSVLRSKCVCKCWLSLISDPFFMNAHHKRQVAHTIQISEYARGELETIECSIHTSQNFNQISYSNILFPNEKYKKMELAFVGCHYGLVCLLDANHNSIYLWNPATKKYKKLPPSPYASPNKDFYKINGLYGFGYEPLTNDFKVVGIRATNFGNLFRKSEDVLVYSLRSNSWKTLVMPDLFSTHVDTNYVFGSYNMVSVVINASIHWLIYFPPTQHGQDYVFLHHLFEKQGIVGFDLSSDEFKLIKLPSSFENKGTSICNLDCCLSLVTKLSLLTSLTEIWVMKKYGVWDSWTKHLSVELVEINALPPLGNFIRILIRPCTLMIPRLSRSKTKTASPFCYLCREYLSMLKQAQAQLQVMSEYRAVASITLPNFCNLTILHRNGCIFFIDHYLVDFIASFVECDFVSVYIMDFIAVCLNFMFVSLGVSLLVDYTHAIAIENDAIPWIIEEHGADDDVER
ncbi:hypothetical protein G4B88_027708 [Cannabis sativa]|uniref:F-box domain-containing protein n=1 Tax=Cannabis sativa TaxID=3483 RepID=A0A7J6ERZ5_CANSA|nr:hypothetical protein G4B88_027708 [Cannabis sativa]